MADQLDAIGRPGRMDRNSTRLPMALAMTQNCSFEDVFAMNVCCTPKQATELNYTNEALGQYIYINNAVQNAENVVDAVVGFVSLLLNLLLIFSCGKLLSRGKLPWRRYHVVRNTSLVDLFASVFLSVTGSVILIDRHYPDTIPRPFRKSVMMSMRNIYECFAIILGLDVCVTSFVQIIALKLPITYRIKLTKRYLNWILAVEWVYTLLHCVVSIAASFPNQYRVQLAYYHLMVMFLFFIFTTMLCVVSLIAVMYFIVKLDVNCQKLFQKIWKAQGVNFWLIGVVYFVNSIVFATFMKPAFILENQVHKESCEIKVKAMHTWLIYHRDYFQVLTICRFMTKAIILQHPLFHIFTNQTIKSFLVTTFTIRRVKRSRATTTLETFPASPHSPPKTSPKTSSKTIKPHSNVDIHLDPILNSPLLPVGII